MKKSHAIALVAALMLIPLITVWGMTFVGVASLAYYRESTLSPLINDLPNDVWLQAEGGSVTLAFPRTDPFVSDTGLSASFVRYKDLSRYDSIFFDQPTMTSTLGGSFAWGQYGRRETHDPYLMADWLVTVPIWLPSVLIASVCAWAMWRDIACRRKVIQEIDQPPTKPNKSEQDDA